MIRVFAFVRVQQFVCLFGPTESYWTVKKGGVVLLSIFLFCFLLPSPPPPPPLSLGFACLFVVFVVFLLAFPPHLFNKNISCFFFFFFFLGGWVEEGTGGGGGGGGLAFVCLLLL